jgi:hypothetical protein
MTDICVGQFLFSKGSENSPLYKSSGDSPFEKRGGREADGVFLYEVSDGVFYPSLRTGYFYQVSDGIVVVIVVFAFLTCPSAKTRKGLPF